MSTNPPIAVRMPRVTPKIFFTSCPGFLDEGAAARDWLGRSRLARRGDRAHCAVQ